MKPVYIAAYHHSPFGKLMALGVPEIVTKAVRGACDEIKAEPRSIDVGSIGAVCNFTLNEQGLLAGLMAMVPGLEAKPLGRLEALELEGHAWGDNVAEFRLIVSRPFQKLRLGTVLAPQLFFLAAPDKVEPYVNACDTKVFRRTTPSFTLSGKKILVCSARLIPKKGVRHAIEAMPAILARYPSHLYIVGEGVLKPELEQLVSDLRLQDSGTFLGKRPNTEMPPFLSSGDVALVPSFYAETSIAALEAMARPQPRQEASHETRPGNPSLQ